MRHERVKDCSGMKIFSRNHILQTAKRVLVLAAMIGACVPASASTTDKSAAVQNAFRANIGISTAGNYLAGRQAQRLNDYASAVEFMGAVLEDNPQSPTILRRTFIMMVMIGQMDEAIELARRMEKLVPDDQIGNLVRVAADLKSGNYTSAAKRFSKAKKSGLNSIIMPPVMAWVRAGEGKTVAAALKELEALKPVKKKQQPLELEHTALIYEFMGEVGEARKQYKSLFDGGAWKALRFTQHYAEFLERQDNKAQARTVYDTFLKAQPETHILDRALARYKKGDKPKVRIGSATEGVAEVLFDVASSLNQQNARDTALILARVSQYLKPDFPALEYMMATILDSSERLEEALAVYRGINVKSEFSRPAKLSVVSLLDRLEETEPALELLRKLAKELKDEPRPLELLGNILRRHERYDEATKAYDEAIGRVGELKPHNWNLLYSRGITHERSKRWELAEADFLKALELQPDQPYVLNYLGYSWIEKGLHLAKAEKMIRRAVEQRPSDGFIIDSLGWIYYQLGKYGQAVSELEHAIELRPQDPIINEHLGDAYWRIGRKLEASFQWRRAIDLKPEPDVIEKIRDKLENGLGKPEKIIKTKDGKATTPG